MKWLLLGFALVAVAALWDWRFLTLCGGAAFLYMLYTSRPDDES